MGPEGDWLSVRVDTVSDIVGPAAADRLKNLLSVALVGSYGDRLLRFEPCLVHQIDGRVRTQHAAEFFEEAW